MAIDLQGRSILALFPYSDRNGVTLSIVSENDPEEPTVTFRAKDILSTMVLNHYASLLEIYDPYGRKAEQLQEAIYNFQSWQRANPDKVRLPD